MRTLIARNPGVAHMSSGARDALRLSRPETDLGAALPPRPPIVAFAGMCRCRWMPLARGATQKAVLTVYHMRTTPSEIAAGRLVLRRSRKLAASVKLRRVPVR